MEIVENYIELKGAITINRMPRLLYNIKTLLILRPELLISFNGCSSTNWNKRKTLEAKDYGQKNNKLSDS